MDSDTDSEATQITDETKLNLCTTIILSRDLINRINNPEEFARLAFIHAELLQAWQDMPESIVLLPLLIKRFHALRDSLLQTWQMDD